MSYFWNVLTICVYGKALHKRRELGFDLQAFKTITITLPIIIRNRLLSILSVIYANIKAIQSKFSSLKSIAPLNLFWFTLKIIFRKNNDFIYFFLRALLWKIIENKNYKFFSSTKLKKKYEKIK